MTDRTTDIVRDVHRCAGRRYDAVIVGGGIYGVLAALEGAARGHAVLLLERGDFGGGTSFNSLRTIHGGLRYLQTLDVARAVSSSRQRWWWLTHFPDLVRPIRCLMPLYATGLRRPLTFRAALLAARALGIAALPGVPARDAMRVIAADAVVARFSAVARDGLAGGAVWHDAFMPSSSRVLMECLRWAVSAGASVLNYAELERATLEPSGDWVLHVTDHAGATTFTVRAARVINAAGPGVDDVAARLGAGGRHFVPTLAWNLLLARPPAADVSVAVTPPNGGRTYFLHPFHGRLLAGTGHAPVEGQDAQPAVRDAHIAAMLDDLNAAVPALGLRRNDVLHVLGGLLPGVRAGDAALQTDARIIGPGTAPCWTLVGVKFTEAPAVARRVWDRMAGRRRQPLPPRPAPTPVPEPLALAVADCATLSRELSAVAVAEAACSADDVVWRRTEAWIDDRVRRRAYAVLAVVPSRRGSECVS